MEEILSLFHHIHHQDSQHKVHHCGGEHVKIDSKVNYQIKHCSCGKHQINKKEAIGHATGRDIKPIVIKIKFKERCTHGGWHVESGDKV